MEGICNDGPGLWTPDALTDARSLQLAMTTTDFICAVVCQAVTSSIQAEAKDIVAAVKEIDTLTATLQSVRDIIDTHHSVFHCGEDVCRCRYRAFFASEMRSTNPSQQCCC